MAPIHGIKAVDLMLGYPGGEGGGARSPQAFMESESREFSRDPVQYLFKYDPEKRQGVMDPDDLVELIDAFGIEVAQVDININQPERVLELLERYPQRFFGTVNI